MAAPTPRTDLPFPEALREFLSERRTLPPKHAAHSGRGSQRATLNALAARAGVGQSHLWRVVNRPAERRPTLDLIAKIAAALELPDDYFLEMRAHKVDGYLRTRPERLNQLYAEARRERERDTPSHVRDDTDR